MVFSFLVGEKTDNFTFEQILLQKFLYKEHRHQQNDCYISVMLEKVIKPCVILSKKLFGLVVYIVYYCQLTKFLNREYIARKR